MENNNNRSKSILQEVLLLAALPLALASCQSDSKKKVSDRTTNGRESSNLEISRKERFYILYPDSFYIIENQDIFVLLNGIKKFVGHFDTVASPLGVLKINPKVTYSFKAGDNKLIIPYKNQSYKINGFVLTSDDAGQNPSNNPVTLTCQVYPQTMGSNFIQIYIVESCNNVDWDFLSGFGIILTFKDKILEKKFNESVSDSMRINGVASNFKITGKLYYVPAKKKAESVGEYLYEGFALMVYEL